jgi:hypothetical protein
VRRRRWIFVACAILVALAVGGALIAPHWPFTPEAAAKSLGDAFASRVQFGTFHEIWFPHPGFNATNVTFIPTKGAEAGNAHVDKLHVDAGWFGLFRHHVREMTFDGVNVWVRALGEGAFAGHAGDSVIEQAELRKAVLQVGQNNNQRFEFADVDLKNVGNGREVTYRIHVAIPRPAGDLELDGKLGAWGEGQVAASPLKGSYRLNRADLRVFDGIAGILSSKGNYSGVLRELRLSGEADVPQFMVVESGHTHHLSAQFQAVVNGTNGDTDLQGIRAAVDHTSFESTAKVEGERAKTATLEIGSGRGRIEDLMLLFIKARQSPILGPIEFRAHITLPPGEVPFKRRVELAGDFGVFGAGFTKRATQASTNQLSERAEGDPKGEPERVLSDLAGHVELRNGVATFSNLSFRVPGAAAHMAGTFNLVTERIDLHGKLATEAELSQTTTGIKSVFLKLLNPIYKRRRAGAVVPVSVTGTYEHPEFRELMTK